MYALFLLVAFLTPHEAVGEKFINLALLVPWTGGRPLGKTIASAATIAVEEINANASIIPDHIIRFTWSDTVCHKTDGLAEIVNFWTRTGENRIHAFIGPGCDEVCEPGGLLAGYWNLPMVSWGCTSDHLSNKDDYPTLARTVGPFSMVSPMIVAVLDHWSWQRVGFIVSTEVHWQITAETIKVELENNGKDIGFYHSFEPGHEQITDIERHRHKDILREMKKRVRIILICASRGDVREIMLNAYDLNMLSGDFTFLSFEVDHSAYKGDSTWMGDDGRDREAHDAFNGLLNIHVSAPHTKEYETFKRNIRKKMRQEPFKHNILKSQQVGSHAALLHDAIILYALALNDHLNNSTNSSEANLFDGQGIARQMFGRQFYGESGNVNIDDWGNRYPDYVLQDFTNDDFHDFAHYSKENHSLQFKEDFVVIFPGGSSEPPRDHPDCGWENELCAEPADIGMVIGLGISGILMLVLAIASFFCYRKVKSERDLNQVELWRISYDEITFTSSSKSIINKSRSSLQSGLTDKSSGKDLLSGNTNIFSQLFTIVGYYRGRQIALKKINKQHVNLDRITLKEMSEMRQMNHENINQFVGVVIEPSVYIISSYCSKGSLQDIIENESIKLDKDFNLSLATDIAQGMSYIHKSVIKSHGNLKSSNCLVDSRWICKIADYGLPTFRTRGVTNPEVTEYQQYYNLFWTAPEIIRMYKRPPAGTQKGDIYSFGIILAELHLRGPPFASQDYSPEAKNTFLEGEPKAIIQAIKVGEHPYKRPKVPIESCAALMHSLMKDCWSEDPEYRPTFDYTRKMLKEISGGKTVNIVDKMVKMMEKYALNLEQLVDERTVQLQEEKKKTDELLYRMLPSYVAEQLKHGKLVAPESFEEVTVFFSDIVRFTMIASESSPMQIVNLLNDLYTLFDDVIEMHDVYKVETIGDAYMVASGLPKRNGQQHAAEIATMALNLLHAINSFEIKHRPGEQLQLRIGIHTGPVVAGIVGLKMPRYCLFGDTVNTASRMESSGLALRVHVSETTMAILRQLGGFELDSRGVITIKGKGSMNTYWLVGKLGFDKSLPDLLKAARVDEHEFK